MRRLLIISCGATKRGDPGLPNLGTIKRRTSSVVARNRMTDTTASTPAVADLLARARVYEEGSHVKQTRLPR
jgi:hypothetical protein